MPVQKRSAGFVSRTVVPPDLRPFIRRCEIVRSLGTGDSREARQRAVRFKGRLSALFQRLRQDGATMDQNKIDALVQQYLRDALSDIDMRLASGTWKSARGDVSCRDGGYDWNEFAQSVLAERGEELQDALAYNRLKETLTHAERLLPEAPQEIVQLLARRLLRAKYEANLAEFRALRGEPLPRVAASTTVPDAPPQESPPLSAMVSDYIEFKRAGRKWTRKTKLQHYGNQGYPQRALHAAIGSEGVAAARFQGNSSSMQLIDDARKHLGSEPTSWMARLTGSEGYRVLTAGGPS